MQKTSGLRLSVFLAMSVLALLFVRHALVDRAERSDAAMMRRAEALASHWFSIIEGQKESAGIQREVSATVPWAGMIGVEWSPFTTTLGSLEAKRAAANPRFAALLIRWMHDAGVDSTSAVGILLSGSFPSLGVAALAAVQTIGAHAVIVSSLGASSYGANQPGATWIDLESWLRREGGLRYASALVTMGAEGDSGGGLSEEGTALLQEAARRNGVALTVFPSFEHSVRMKEELLASAQIDLLVNIGGNQTSLGTCRHAGSLPTGLLLRRMHCTDPGRGLIERCAARGLPVVHMLNIRALASQYGLPLLPSRDESSGVDGVFYASRVHRAPLLLILFVLAGLLAFWLPPRFRKPRFRKDSLSCF
jgi:poly-gamma-glutamate system protein